ncbi:MAG TPA: dTDP-glucose 4,6-dehydratase [Patescibacteria group bacterium]|nr:dTDP-glucose 4,6-dehydratase [Patescibacteria group bacterium]
MKLLVTGGAGFIGTNFVRYWVDRYPEDEIAVLDKLTYAGHLENLKGLKIDFIKGDICDRKVVARAMAGVDVVVHFAAETHVDRSIIDPDIFIKSNIIGTETLCRAAIKAKIKRFHHISTDEVFGALALTTNGKFTEKTAYSPRSPYAVSKATSDFIVRMYHHTYGLPITITNTSNNYGPYQDPEKFIPRMITNAIDNQPLPIYGDGLYVRDWIHTYDHCTAIDLILTKGKVGETYLVGANSERNNLTVVKLILKYLGKPESLITFVKDRPGHDRRYALDSRKIKRELGWKPEHKFEYWLKRVVKWYVDNEAWWRPLKKRAESIYK